MSGGAPKAQNPPGLTGRAANVDEVYIDLCRQILGRDDAFLTPEMDDGGIKLEVPRSSNKRRRRARVRDHNHRKCAIL